MIDDERFIADGCKYDAPVGSELAARGSQSPIFLPWAIQDPDSVKLQRLQIIKGWVNGGKTHEKVFDTGCSNGVEVDPATHRCPDNGATVNLTDCSYSKNKGDADLRAQWQDPTFAAGQRSIYYVRVLENPKCRWSTWNANQAKVPPNPWLKATIQDRAWSSPFWYLPGK